MCAPWRVQATSPIYTDDSTATLQAEERSRTRSFVVLRGSSGTRQTFARAHTSSTGPDHTCTAYRSRSMQPSFPLRPLCDPMCDGIGWICAERRCLHVQTSLRIFCQPVREVRDWSHRATSHQTYHHGIRTPPWKHGIRAVNGAEMRRGLSRSGGLGAPRRDSNAKRGTETLWGGDECLWSPSYVVQRDTRISRLPGV